VGIGTFPANPVIEAVALEERLFNRPNSNAAQVSKLASRPLFDFAKAAFGIAQGLL
jgi:hypothetical protein